MVHTLKHLFILVLFLPVLTFAQDPGTITTFAGGGAAEGEGIPATDLALNVPLDAVIDSDGNLYIADRGNHRIRKVDRATGTVTTVAGTGQAGFSGDGGPATSAQLNSPQAVVLDQSGNIYIADALNRRIRKIDIASGVISTLAGTGERGVEGGEGPASSIAFDDIVGLLAVGNESLYISENAGIENIQASAYRVRRMDLVSGAIQNFAGTGNFGFSGDGGPATEAGLAPGGLALDASGNIYIADFNNHRIRRVDIDSGIITTVAGRGPTNPFTGEGGFGGDGGAATEAFLNIPFGVALAPDGTLYIADNQNQVIRSVDAETQTIVTVAGTPGQLGSGGDGGLALNAQLGEPGNILVDPDGNLLIVDTGNHRIRRLFDPTFRVVLFVQITEVIDYDRVSAGDPSTRLLQVGNRGNAILTVQGATSNNPDFVVLSTFPLQIGPSQEGQIQIQYNPLKEGVSEGLITITTGDPRTPTATVPVTGFGTAPAIGVQPDQLLTFTRTFVGREQTRQILISNLGEGLLIVPRTTVTDTQFIVNLADTLRLSSGQAQALSITFRPTRGGLGETTLQEATLDLFSNDPIFPTFALRLEGLSQIPRDGGFASVGPARGMGDPGPGFGVAWSDYDGDGDIDLYVVRSLEPNLLYRNDGTAFTESAAALGVNDAGDGSAALWADYDNDGDLDFYVTNFGQPNRLFRNDGTRFTPVEDQSGVADGGDGYGAAWADYDNDGDPDLYVANFGPNRFYQNNGGLFTDLADSLGLSDLESGIQPAWGDFDADGDPDLFLANSGPNRLFRNQNGTFESIESLFNPRDTGPSFGAAWGDVDNDGDLDLYVPYFNEKNRLYINEGDNFRDVATTSGIAHTGRGRGAVWGDFDNDGDLDLYVTNSGQPNLFFRNSGGVFTEEADSMGVGTTADSPTVTAQGDTVKLAEDSRGVALADFDLDGGLDLYVAVQDGPDRLYRNQEANGNWLIVRPIGTKSSHDAIGTRIEIVYKGNQQAFREITGGASFLSQDALVASFGVDDALVLDRLTVRWPSGIVQQFQSDLFVNRIRDITEQAPLPPSRIGLEATNRFLTANGMAETQLRATVLDDNNEVVLVNDLDIFFTLESGEGIFVGGDSIRTRDGVATVRFQAGRTVGPVSISAGSPGLIPARITIELVRPLGTEELTIRTVAGANPLLGDFGGDGGPATEALFRGPRAVVVDAAGNIYIADSGNHLIRRVDAATDTIQTYAGAPRTAGLGTTGDDGPALDARLSNPRGLALFSNGDLLFSESGSHVLRRIFASNDTIVGFAGRAVDGFGGDGKIARGANFRSPVGVVTDIENNVWVADQFNHRIRKIDLQGIITTVGGSGSTGPNAGGFGGDGTEATQARLNAPRDVAVDSLGRLYIADTNNNRIRMIDENGIISTVAGTDEPGAGGDGGPAILAQLDAPSGVAIDGAGHLYVADQNNNRIRLIDLNTGLIQTVAGTGFGQLDLEEGPALEVSLNSPQGLSIGPTGTLFIADQANHRIRELTILFPATPGLRDPDAGKGTASIDFNGDNRINLSDFLLFAAAFRTPVPDPRFDLNVDGLIDFADFLDFAVAFEQSRLSARKP